MKKLFHVFGLCAILAFAVSSSGLAAWGSGNSVKGRIAAIDSNMLTVMEKSNDQLNVAVQVKTDDQTKFKQVSSLNQLKEGDIVDVSYKETDGLKVATSISKVEQADQHNTY